MIRGLIFDVDETLLYYEGYTLRRWYEEVGRPAMEKLGVLLDWETFRRIVRGELSRRYVERFGIDHVEFWKAMDRANKAYRERLLEEGKIKPFPDAGALEELRALGLKLAAVSNASQDNTELVLKAFGLDRYFDVILGKDYSYLDGVKPNPYLLNKALKVLGLKKDEVLLVGDSSNDVLAGRNAGIKTVNIVRFERVPGADYYVNTLWELVNLVKELRAKNPLGLSPR
ncbi:HAD family hydrolase [Thermococcus gammatolerans]|uniref:Hydrolase, HAD superfamily, Putative phosphoglycolate phosphatase (Gph) n=1 Tax=Thermococcus gammatolerans (strain DSM 15229 / JCM 11827 / EJ3) TaxID=593117 RepID=C5A703_THEGJ|nr:HAD family hydrolase [Thermococcus gammatolerans]ACS34015.1 Hydrolase, HAD superfamily, Putative phosphoglycolate phosphatase (gph) [Thermococcus gammatolerans EJ3]